MSNLIRAAAIAACVFVYGLAAAADAEVVKSEAGTVNVEPLAKLDNPWDVAVIPPPVHLVVACGIPAAWKVVQQRRECLP